VRLSECANRTMPTGEWGALAAAVISPVERSNTGKALSKLRDENYVL